MYDLRYGEFNLCIQMQCPLLVQPADCVPAKCKRLDDERKRLGSIYLIRPDGIEADFVAMLPRRRKEIHGNTDD